MSDLTSYPSAPRNDPCNGCHACGLRCTAGIQITEPEYRRIVTHLRAGDPATLRRVLGQEKRLPWFEGVSTQACLFRDVQREGCAIYPVRPLICRLFGRVEWLPCPAGQSVPQLPEGVGLIQRYADEKRLTFEEWLAANHIFDPLDLLPR